MSGGLMQIVAKGAQDTHLTSDPEITFFKAMHRRHTNFSVESIEQTFDGVVNPNGRVSATIARNGDLVHRMWLEITCDDPSNHTPFAWDSIENVSIEIGGTMIDTHTGRWLQMWYELTEKDSWFRDECLTKGTNKTLRIPLSFWFCKEAGQALPLIALQYHEVKLIVNFSNRMHESAMVKLWVDYIYLDTAERRRFARADHEYLIEQVQTTGIEKLNSSNNAKIELDFNHPVKELVWTVLGEHEEWRRPLDTDDYVDDNDNTIPRNASDALLWIDDDGIPQSLKKAAGSDFDQMMPAFYSTETGKYYTFNGSGAGNKLIPIIAGDTLEHDDESKPEYEIDSTYAGNTEFTLTKLTWSQEHYVFLAEFSDLGEHNIPVDGGDPTSPIDYTGYKLHLKIDDNRIDEVRSPNVAISKEDGLPCVLKKGKFKERGSAKFWKRGDVENPITGYDVLYKEDLKRTPTEELKQIRDGLPDSNDVCYPTYVSTFAATLESARLDLNGHERFKMRDADYFQHVQQHQHHTGRYTGHNLGALVGSNEERKVPAYVYSFALEPEKLQPSGTCNFSRIDNATLILKGERLIDSEVFAVNYNILRIKNGMGGLAYSN